MNHEGLVADIPLFEGLSEEDLAALTAKMTKRTVSRGEVVFSQGERGSSMYVVLTGAVRIFLPSRQGGAEPVVLREAGAGEYFGELSLFSDKPRSATVEATAPTTLLELRGETLEEHLSRSKTASIAIIRVMGERLRNTTEMLGSRAAANAVKELEDNLSWSQRLADKVATLNGSWAFILFVLALSGVWALANYPSLAMRLGLATQAFDPYPYTLFNLVLAILVSLQGPLIVMSQNRQSLKDRAQAETDFRVNLKNEVGIETLARELQSFRVETLKRLDMRKKPRDGVVPDGAADPHPEKLRDPVQG